MGVTLYCCHKGSSSKADFVATLVGAPSSFTFRSLVLLKEADHSTSYPPPVCPTVNLFVQLLWCCAWHDSRLALCHFTFKTMALLAFNLDQPRLLHCLWKLGHNQALPRTTSWFKRNSGLKKMWKIFYQWWFLRDGREDSLFCSSVPWSRSPIF